jgi:hypothetical protein
LRERLTLIGTAVANLLLGRHIFRESEKLISKNRKLRGVFTRRLAINYAYYSVVGIRRAVDNDPRAISFANLLREMIAHSDAISRTTVCLPTVIDYESMKKRQRRARHGLKEFTNFRLSLVLEFFDPLSQEDRLDIRRVQHDLSLLRSKAKNLERFASKRIAHYDEIRPDRIRYSEIDQALDTLNSLMRKYFRLLDLGDWRQRGAEFERRFPGWKRVFEAPWNIQ